MCEIRKIAESSKVVEGIALLDNKAQLPTLGKGTLSKRARSKFYTQSIVRGLFYLESPLQKGYSRAYHCASILKQHDGKITSRYCNSRICHVCNRIRTAKMMAGYIEPLRQLGDLYFTTLTIKNVKAHALSETVEKMLKDMSNIIRVLREKRKINISGIRKIEVTYNAKTDEYHPHFHILHNHNVGSIIITEWLKRNSTANLQGWDRKKKKLVDIQVTKAITKNGEDDKAFLNEIFKYATKFVVKDDKEKGVLNVYAPALDVILRSLHMKRSVQSFGEIRKIVIKEEAEHEELISQEFDDVELQYKEWHWIEDISNWFDSSSKALTDYKPPDIEFKYFIGDCLPLNKKEKRKNKLYEL